MKWLLLSIVFLLPTIIDFCYLNIASAISGPIGNTITAVINKAYYYLHWTSGGWATQIETSISSKMTKIFGVVFIILIMYLIFKKSSKKQTKQHDSLFHKPMVSFLFLMSVFALGCYHIKTGAFWRFESIVVLFSPVLLVQAIDAKIASKKYLYIMTIFIAILLIYNAMYQISNLDSAETVFNLITTPGAKIFLELINGIMGLVW